MPLQVKKVQLQLKDGQNYKDGDLLFNVDAEAWARGTRSDQNVSTTDPTYHNNAAWYATQANNSASAAAQAVLTGNLAPTFSVSTTYSKGDYVIYNGILYCFTANHPVGAWTGTDVTAEKITESMSASAAQIATNTGDIADLKSALDSYVTELPADYTQLEYLESNGTSYVSMGLKADQNTRFVCDFQLTDSDFETSNYIFGGRKSTTNSAFAFYRYSDGHFNVNYNNAYFSIADADYERHIVDFNKNKFYFDGDLKYTTAAGTFESYYNIGLFGARGSTSYYLGTCRIYHVEWYDNDVLIRNFIPCTQITTGKNGFYDTVTESFIAESDYEGYTPLIKSSPYGIEGSYKKIDSLEKKVNSEISDIKNTIPKYVKDEADRVSDKVRNVQTGKSITFAAISDLHYKVDEDGNTIKNALDDMRNGLKAIAGQTHIDFYTCFGDIIWRMSADGDFEKGKAEAIAVTKIINDAFGNNLQLRIIGNHDPNAEGSSGYFTAYQLNSFFGIYSNMFTERREVSYPGSDLDVSYQGDGYIDFERQKIRIITLNTSVYAQDEANQPKQGSTQYRFGWQQAYWLCSVLDCSDKGADAENWKIILFSHIAADETHSGVANKIGKFLTPVLTAYEEGSTWTGSTFSYNFSGKNAANLMLYVNGHAHKYYVKNVTEVDESGVVQKILAMANLYIPNALPDRDYPSVDGVTYTKTAGTADSTAFQVITIDAENKIVYAHHYGAGIDIIMHYEPSTNSSLSTAISLPVWSSVDTSIATVSSGTVTPVTAGYVMIWAKSTTDNCIECWNYQSVV